MNYVGGYSLIRVYLVPLKAMELIWWRLLWLESELQSYGRGSVGPLSPRVFIVLGNDSVKMTLSVLGHLSSGDKRLNCPFKISPHIVKGN